MFKQFTYILLLLSLTLAITDKQIIQQTLDGIYDQNQLTDPATITDCGDDDTNQKIVEFIQTQLDKCSKGSATEIFQLYTNIKNFVNSLPQPVIDCINANPEADELKVAFYIKGVDQAVIENKINNYILLHIFVIRKWMVELDDLWNAGYYYQFGFNGAIYLHEILGIDSTKYIKQRHN